MSLTENYETEARDALNEASYAAPAHIRVHTGRAITAGLFAIAYALDNLGKSSTQRTAEGIVRAVEQGARKGASKW